MKCHLKLWMAVRAIRGATASSFAKIWDNRAAVWEAGREKNILTFQPEMNDIVLGGISSCAAVHPFIHKVVCRELA